MNSGIVKRSCSQVYADYQRYRSYLKIDFFFTCAYCSIAEVEAAARGFQIDHYKPQKLGGAKSDYANLMWSCAFCNGSKKKYWSSDPARRIVNVEFDNPLDHIDWTSRDLHAKSSIGSVTIEVCRLNRIENKKIREKRTELQAEFQKLRSKLNHLQDVKRRLLRRNSRTNVRLVSELDHIVLGIQGSIDRLKAFHKQSVPQITGKMHTRRKAFLRTVNHPSRIT